MLSRRLLLAASAFAARPAGASEPFPTRPLRLIVPYAPGGSTDLLARMVAERIAPGLGQPVVVENRPGGGAIIGSEAAARAAPDGHTLLMATNGSHAINVGIFRSLPYDPLRDFAPVTIVASVPLVLVVAPGFPATTPQELVAYARTARAAQLRLRRHRRLRPPGRGDAEAAGRDRLVHVPYRGDGPALVDVIGGRLAMNFANLPAAIGFIRAARCGPSR